MSIYIDLSSIIDTEPELSEVLNLLTNDDLLWEVLDRMEDDEDVIDLFIHYLKDYPKVLEKLKELLSETNPTAK